MKNKPVIFALTISFILNFQNVFGQMRNVNSAEAYLNSDLKQAKFDIDKAALNSETSNHPKMWMYKGAIYTLISLSSDKDIIPLNKDAAYIAGEALSKFYSFPKKDISKYKDEADYYIQYAAKDCFNQAINKSKEKGNFMIVEQYMVIVQKLIKADSNAAEPKLIGQISTNNTYLLCLGAAQTDSLEDKEIYYLDKLANSNYKDIFVFTRLSDIYLKKNNYEKASEYLNLGKIKYEEFKPEILKYEINIDIEKGKTTELLEKLNLAVANNPEEAIYYFNRGLTYHQLIINARGKEEKSKFYFSQALNDYEKSYSIDPSNYECIFNTGSLLIDSANTIFNKAKVMENGAEKDKLIAMYKPVFKLALEKFEITRLSGEKSGQQLVDLLNAMRQTAKKSGDIAAATKYNQLYNEEKSNLKSE